MIEMVKKYSFAVLDPRNIPIAQEANEKVFSNRPVYGIEVTVPALAKRCVVNIDPQHTGGDASLAAIELAMTVELPAEETTLATVRADVDSLGAMAIFSLRAKGASLEPAKERIVKVAASDRFARGGWPGPQPLPTWENPWPDSREEGILGPVEGTRALAAIAAAVSDFKVPLADRVAVMERWLLTGEEPQQYRDEVEKERRDMIIALEIGQIKVETRSNGRIAVVESTHRAGTSIGYCLAPVVIARNPEFRFAGGEPHVKFTISAFEQKYADTRSALAELATMEAGWGGSPTIGGSPQGVSSKLTVEQVVSVVEKYLPDRIFACCNGHRIKESEMQTIHRPECDETLHEVR